MLSSILVKSAVVAKLVILDILSSISLILVLYTSFLATSFFTTLLTLLKLVGTGTHLSKFNLFILSLTLLKPLGTFF